MRKRVLVCAIHLLLALSLCGCWNYRGLDQMDIVVGIAIDFDKETSRYKISYEVADLEGAGTDSKTKGKLVESEGKTLFDAARNAKRFEADKLYFGSADIVIISEQLAREVGITPVLEWFLRDAECRESMYVAISQKQTAKAILEGEEETDGIVSIILKDLIMEDSQVTGSTMDLRLYEIITMIYSPRDAVMLTALNVPEGEGKTACELNGIAVFKGDKLKGFLTPEESKYALFVENELKGGILTLSTTGTQTDDLSLEIFDNQTTRSYTYEQGTVKIRIQTDTSVAIAENQNRLDVMQEEIVKSIENASARKIERNIENMIAKVQSEFQADIFGFGEMIYKRDLPLWKQLEASWGELSPTIDVEVSSKVRVKSSGFIK